MVTDIETVTDTTPMPPYTVIHVPDYSQCTQQSQHHHENNEPVRWVQTCMNKMSKLTPRGPFPVQLHSVSMVNLAFVYEVDVKTQSWWRTTDDMQQIVQRPDQRSVK